MNNLISIYDANVNSGKISKKDAAELFSQYISKTQYGVQESSYFWILDNEKNILAHPFFDNEKIQSSPVYKKTIDSMVTTALNNKACFFEYKWPYINGDEKSIQKKTAYLKYYSSWGIIVGTGFYNIDILREVKATVTDIYMYIILTTVILVVIFIISLLIDLKKLRSLKDSEARVNELSQIIYQSPTSVVVTNLHGYIEYANPAFEKQTGYSQDELKGQKPNLLKSNNMPDSFYENMWKKISNGEVWKGELLNKDKAGNYFWELASIFPLKNSNGKILKYVGLKTDISEIKQIRNEIERAKEVAEENNRLKTAFLSNISHEINTPLNAIIGFSHLAEIESEGNKKLQSYISYILEHSEILMNIFTEVIKFSKMDAGIFEYKKEKFPVNQFFLDLCIKYNRQIKDTGNNITHVAFIPDKHYGHFDHMELDVDKYVLEEILKELFDNALKYTSEGRIEIGYKINNNKITIFVSDTGLGIPEEEKGKIFQLFYQGKKEFISLRKGLGVGLNKVKFLTNQMDGELDFESITGKGARFWITLPQKALYIHTEEQRCNLEV